MKRKVSGLDGLDKDQKKAVLGKTPCSVIAGPGSGKTRVVTHKAIQMVKDNPGKYIYVSAFTRSAAREIKERVSEVLLKKDARRLVVGTVHSIALKLLKLHHKAPSSIIVLSQADRNALVKQSIDTAKIEHEIPKGYTLSNFNRDYGEYYQGLLDKSDPKYAIVELVLDIYVKIKNKHGYRDFDDIITEASSVLACSDHHFKEDFFLIDEFQDIDRYQLDFIRSTVPEENIAIVADPDQRGAVPEVVKLMQERPNHTKYELTTNYRSLPSICQSAEAIINAGKWDTELRSINPILQDDSHVYYYECYSAYEENTTILNLVSNMLKNYEPKDIAVITRYNQDVNIIFNKLFSSGINAHVLGVFNYFDRAEIQDVLAYLILTQDKHSDVHWSRIINVPTRGIGKATLEKLRRAAYLHDTTIYNVIREVEKYVDLPSKKVKELNLVADLIDKYEKEAKTASVYNLIKFIIDDLEYEQYLLKDPEYEKRLGHLNLFLSYAASWERDQEQKSETQVLDFVNELALLGDEEGQRDKNAVTVTNVHQAKGKEWKVVIVSLQKGLVDDDPEEQRVLYVAVSRAKEQLLVTHQNLFIDHLTPAMKLSCATEIK